MADYCKRCPEPRVAHAQGLCSAHLRRQRLDRDLDAPLGPNYPALHPVERLAIAALQFADLSDVATAEDYRRAMDRLRKAAVAYSRARRRKAPPSAESGARA